MIMCTVMEAGDAGSALLPCLLLRKGGVQLRTSMLCGWSKLSVPWYVALRAHDMAAQLTTYR
jgi:hypothetical protein